MRPIPLEIQDLELQLSCLMFLTNLFRKMAQIASECVVCIVISTLIHFGIIDINMWSEFQIEFGQLKFKDKTYSINFHVDQFCKFWKKMAVEGALGRQKTPAPVPLACSKKNESALIKWRPSVHVGPPLRKNVLQKHDFCDFNKKSLIV